MHPPEAPPYGHPFAAITLDQARLDGVRLLARTAEHEVNSALTPALVYAEVLAEWEGLPPDAQVLAQKIFASVQKASSLVQAMKRIQRLDEIEWAGLEPTLDLAASAA